MAHVESSFLWGNWTVYNLASIPGHSIWLADDAILHGKDARACFKTLGSMRTNVTVDLWTKLGIKSQFPNGWLLPDQSIPSRNLLPSAFSDRMVGRHIIARTVLPQIIQCTCDGDGAIVKQCVQKMGEEKLPVEKAPNLFDESTLKETRTKSTEIFSALQQLCHKRGILGIDGLRITWGITAEGNVLTPIGGFGLPDHARYFLADKGQTHILDRRFAKIEWTSGTGPQDGRALSRRIPAMARELEDRYGLCHSALMAQ